MSNSISGPTQISSADMQSFAVLINNKEEQRELSVNFLIKITAVMLVVFLEKKSSFELTNEQKNRVVVLKNIMGDKSRSNVSARSGYGAMDVMPEFTDLVGINRIAKKMNDFSLENLELLQALISEGGKTEQGWCFVSRKASDVCYMKEEAIGTVSCLSSLEQSKARQRQSMSSRSASKELKFDSTPSASKELEKKLDSTQSTPLKAGETEEQIAVIPRAISNAMQNKIGVLKLPEQSKPVSKEYVKLPASQTEEKQGCPCSMM